MTRMEKSAVSSFAFAQNEIVLLDGGMGQELLARSDRAATPLWSAQVMLDQPELVRCLHEDFIRAGANVITLNNYSATRQRLRRDGAPNLFVQLHSMAIDAAHKARESSSSTIAIAGCLPPLVASYIAALAPEHNEALESYEELVQMQAESVDLFICETMASIGEACAAAKAACASGIPVWVSLTVNDNDGLRLRSDEPLSEAIAELSCLPVEALLINCSSPEAIDAAMPTMIDSQLPVGAYANGFTTVSPLRAGGTVSSLSARRDLDPLQYSEHAMQWVQQGASIVGGCCEVGPAHIEQLAQSLTHAGLRRASPAS